ncbi:flagellar biosynthesis protein FlhF [Clostridiales bacterium oral taxon 876 str. F0540]|nr:flagellar biosynthesis protein FlhF [Clostridiales bacterium oral taxon 876 str. F0540]
MIIKRYIVSSMNEAMTRIRYELGKDAVIISQRKIRKPGIKGFFSKKILEVTAAIENVKKNDEDIVDSIEAIKKAVEKETVKSSEPLKNEVVEESKVSSKDSDLFKEMQEMKNLLSDMMNKTPEKTQRRSKLQIRLEDVDLNEKIVKKVLTKVKSFDENLDETQKARMAIEKLVPIAKVKMEGAVVLVGPTGVGKTTTIAKLAGKLSLIDKKKVGLITIDTYRIGAVEQLKTYADIMNIPFKVVFTMKEMDSAIDAMRDCDVVLIDTTGRSSKNTMQISELRAFVEKANTNNIHLVISSTTKNKDVEAIIEGYKILNYNNVIITKLDETSTYGSILNILDSAKKPLSFITTGQNVPDDIKSISSSEVASLILGEDNIC